MIPLSSSPHSRRSSSGWLAMLTLSSWLLIFCDAQAFFDLSQLTERVALMEFKKSLQAYSNFSSIAQWHDHIPVCDWPGVGCNADLRVTKLQLSGNQISGPLPLFFDRLEELEELWMLNNMFTSSLPAEWSQLQKLKKLFLIQNQLTGTIPKEWSTMKSMEFMLLFFNDLSGPLPAEWAAMSNLVNLSLHSNKLTGTLPAAWGGLTSLRTLNLSVNNLVGDIPSSWGSMRSLESINLLWNTGLNITQEPVEWAALPDKFLP
eukprot:CAMPEP_0117677350 /NCGR_PEP_ID=MMETSP0804-20121206/16698_1 /TAXON_ID=1074897 /ORGANISM="Tetraselmis astigmatica, Strain CCMP880" /LENGTH=260 /DNA_ID=CAMNT_0005486627 /DNA_START=140 /DNA_END=922 /DNA_ORIENTATION=+